MTDERLLVQLDLLPGPVPDGAPLYRHSTEGRPGEGPCILYSRRIYGKELYFLVGTYAGSSSACRASLDLSPPPIDKSWPARIDGADVGAGMLARAMFPGQGIEGAIWHRSWRGYYELHVWLTGESGRAREVPFGDRFSSSDAYAGNQKSRHAVIEHFDGPFASRLALAAVLRSQSWKAQ